MSILSDRKGNLRFWLKSYFFLGVAAITLVVFLYSNHIINRMREQSAATPRLFSRFIAEVVLQADEPGKRGILQEVLKEIRLPIILTDIEGRPIAWHRVGIPEPKDEDFETLLAIDPFNPPPGKYTKLIDLTKKFDNLNDPIPVRMGSGGPPQGLVHFGHSKLQRDLRIMPLIQLAIFLVFMAVGFQGFRSLKLSEQRSIYVGMAKETAHQLGTPLSALLGWNQLLKDQCREQDYISIESTLMEMEEDLKRLHKVTDRFSKIGSTPELKPIDLSALLERTVSYFHRRLPRLKTNTTLDLYLDETPQVLGNHELLEWVFENLIKNSIDAIGEKGGTIVISGQLDSSRRTIDIFVKDNGKGIPASQRREVFSPGYTTKTRGWGLGLALTKRIVEDYHRGDLRLQESQLGKGTTFLVRLPLA